MLIEGNPQTPPAAGAVPDTGDTTPPGAVDNGASAGTDNEEPKEPKVFTQEEVDRIAGEARAKERRKIRQEEQQRANQPTPPPAEPPKPADFKSAQEYFDAASDWKAKHIAYDSAIQQQAQQAANSFEDRTDKARTKHADIDIIFKSPAEGGPAIHPSVKGVIQKSDLGPEVAYHLAKNPDLARSIYHMDPIDQAREIGKIEATLGTKTQAPAANQGSSAPEPIEPLAARGGAQPPVRDTSDPRATKTMSVSEWIEAENKRRAKLNQR